MELNSFIMYDTLKLPDTETDIETKTDTEINTEPNANLC